MFFRHEGGSRKRDMMKGRSKAIERAEMEEDSLLISGSLTKRQKGKLNKETKKEAIDEKMFFRLSAQSIDSEREYLLQEWIHSTYKVKHFIFQI